MLHQIYGKGTMNRTQAFVWEGRDITDDKISNHLTISIIDKNMEKVTEMVRNYCQLSIWKTAEN
jgi:hypothetical protein